MAVNRKTMATVRNVIRDDPRVARAHAAMLAQGVGEKHAQEEIARCVLGCVFERSRGKPDRFTNVLKGIEEGRTAEALFPDVTYMK